MSNLRILATASTIALLAGRASSQTLSVLIDEAPESAAMMEALTDAYSAANEGVTFDIEILPGGGAGDNVVKTRLATHETADIFAYNTGSLFQALNPANTLLPLNDIPNQGNILDSLKSVVSDADGNF